LHYDRPNPKGGGVMAKDDAMTDILKYPRGTIVLFEEGEYSDFGYCGQVVTLQELDLQAEVAAWNERYPEHSWDRGPSDFVSDLIARQIVAPLDCQTVHIGSGKVKLGV
jgi:hypothetical protein